MQRQEVQAREFYTRKDSVDLVAKYLGEMDAEVRSDAIKTAMYVIYRQGGMDTTFAAMNACRRAPGASNVDRHFSEKSRHRMNNMAPKSLQKIVNMAQQAGISTQGKVYVGGLGRYQDPGAWVSTADDVVETARRRNMTVTGSVRHEGTPVPPPQGPKLAKDIVDGHVAKILKSEPKTLEKVQRNKKHLNEVRERVVAKHAPKKRYHG